MLELLVKYLPFVTLIAAVLIMAIIKISMIDETPDESTSYGMTMSGELVTVKTPIPTKYNSDTMEIVLNFYHSNNIIIPLEIIDEHEDIQDIEELFSAIEESRKIWKLENSKPIPKSKMKKLLNE